MADLRQKEICDSFDLRYSLNDMSLKDAILKVKNMIKDMLDAKDLTQVEGTMAWALNNNIDKIAATEALLENQDADAYKKLRDMFMDLISAPEVKETDTIRKVKNLIIPEYDKAFLNMGKARSLLGYQKLLNLRDQ